jgi:opine dehydrogenase
MARIWIASGLGRLPLLGETATLPQAARFIGPTELRIRFFWRPRAAAFPASRTDALLEALRPYSVLLQPVRARHVLDSGLSNPNFIIHPFPMLLNFAAIERVDGRFSLMNEGMTEVVLRAMEAHDRERMALLEAVCVPPLGLDGLYVEFGGTPSIYRSPGEPMGLRDHIHWRYIDEDVPYGCVFMSSLGDLVNVPTPINDALNTLASVVRGVDFWSIGRTVERLGLAGLWGEKLVHFLQTGER